ncbi:MAG: GNAT family N-acetyltransferase [Mogibacterium sp.]|nr:GNAT family N-acetyltransferase [Mogibacterium sp.]
MITDRFEFRDIRPEESDQAAEIEQIVFPPHEAVFPDDVREHAYVAPDCFLVAVDRETGLVAGFLYGLATDESAFRDEFFTDVSLHVPDGQNIILLGLDVLPEYQGQGLGRAIMTEYCRREKAKGRSKLILTCLENLVGMYEKFGFVDLGISGSTWGGEEWHEMDLTLNP